MSSAATASKSASFTSSSCEEDEEMTMIAGEDASQLAFTAISMMLNNNMNEAEKLFEKYKDKSPLMSAGSSFVAFMQAVMSFEDEKLAEAMLRLQETENRCSSKGGWFKSFKTKFKRKENCDENLEQRLQCQIIVADSQLYQAVLTFINQDVASYIKGGWILRKAWKIYDKTYHEIKQLYDNIVHDNQSTNGRRKSSTGLKPVDATVNSNRGSQSLNDIKNFDGNSVCSDYGADAMTGRRDSDYGRRDSNVSLNSQSSTDSQPRRLPRINSLPHGDDLPVIVDELGNALTEDTVARLMGAVSFGYGTFQLCLSLIPPKILRIIEFLGFEGDRDIGLRAMEFSSHSKDMKAPLSTLGLLWYHTVIRPFFSIDGDAVDAGVSAADAIIKRCEREYPDSALFLFFKGRSQRLQTHIEESLVTYECALEASHEQREIQLICLYEIGWSNMIKLNWKSSAECFLRLKEESRWSKAYYAYLTALCFGANGDLNESYNLMKQVPGLVKRKNNQIEAFVARRAEKFRKVEPTQDQLVIHVLEVLYLWNTLPSCKTEHITAMQKECESLNDRSLFHLRSLIEGALWREAGEVDLAIQCFEEAIARHSGCKDDQHVPAYASFELGTIYAKHPETRTKGKELLNKAKDLYEGYDFENRLHARIMSRQRLYFKHPTAANNTNNK
ncbi:tetratricopeptide repeat protein 39C-like [Tubulanus polymorphus]|uniref:tetratricopeptide repeat protein 39C-like n=1 Tax=Tubulanus polymorphus TaxID=672921 RepID=UPI003DA28162